MQGYRNKLNFRAENIALELSKTFSQCLKPGPKKSHEKNECFTKYQFHNANMAKKIWELFFTHCACFTPFHTFENFGQKCKAVQMKVTPLITHCVKRHATLRNKNAVPQK